MQNVNKVMGHANYGVGVLGCRLSRCKASDTETCLVCSKRRTARRPACGEQNEGRAEGRASLVGTVGQGKDLELEIPFCFSLVTPSALEPPPLNGKPLKSVL